MPRPDQPRAIINKPARQRADPAVARAVHMEDIRLMAPYDSPECENRSRVVNTTHRYLFNRQAFAVGHLADRASRLKNQPKVVPALAQTFSVEKDSALLSSHDRR